MTFQEVLGNEIAVKSLQEAIKSDSPPHAYLLSGYTGAGKTTLARIIAKELDCFVEQLDAATNSGIDETRKLVDKAGFGSIMTEKNRMYIIEEAHNLSKKGFEPLLLLLESPPPHLYVALCSTEPSAIPKTVHNRCHPVPLKPLKAAEIETLISAVSDVEGWKLTNDVFEAMVQASEGSARKALSILQAGHSLQNRAELAQVIVEVETEDSPALALASYLIRGGRAWDQVKKMLDKIEEFDAAIIQITRSFTADMIRSASEQKSNTSWKMLESFVNINSYDAKSRLYSAIGRIVWNS
jgi:DNA polymerase III gamma/tau subunit